MYSKMVKNDIRSTLLIYIYKGLVGILFIITIVIYTETDKGLAIYATI